MRHKAEALKFVFSDLEFAGKIWRSETVLSVFWAPDFTLLGRQTRTFAVRFFAFYGFYLNSARRFGALVATSLQIYLAKMS